MGKRRINKSKSNDDEVDSTQTKLPWVILPFCKKQKSEERERERRKRRRMRRKGEEDEEDKRKKGEEDEEDNGNGIQEQKDKNKKGNEPILVPTVLSDEQEEISQCVLELYNTQVIAKAGSGKTTTSITIAKRFFDRYQKRTLILTYNTRLKFETRERIDKMGVKLEMECHSYHAAACKFFSPAGFEPQEIDNGLLFNAMRYPARRPMNFGLIIIDETQDMNELYYKFVVHILKQCPSPPVILLLGDPFQRIFSFNGACCDYLLQPQTYFAPYVHPMPFVTRHLTICWRITHEMAQFINTKLNPTMLQYTSPEWWKTNGDIITALWGIGIRANPNRAFAPGSVVYYKTARFSDSRCVSEANVMFDMFGNDDVALLGFSLKNRTPISFCVDKLGKGTNENWLVLSSEGEFKPDELLFRGKRVASTIHKFKGLERRGILICGMNDFIEKFDVSNMNPLNHFNLYYVACTRAKDRLVIQMLSADDRQEYATIRASPFKTDRNRDRFCSVTNLVAYVPFDCTLSVRDQLFNVNAIEQSIEGIHLTSEDRLIDGRVAGTKEDVSTFIGTAIHAKLQILLTGKLQTIALDKQRVDSDMYEWYNRIKTCTPHDLTWTDLVKYAIIYETVLTEYTHYWRQIVPNISAIKPRLLDQCVANALFGLYNTVKTIQSQSQSQFTSQSQSHPTSTLPSIEYIIDYLRPITQCEVPTNVSVPFTWFQEYLNTIQGAIDLVIAVGTNLHMIVELKVSNQLRFEHMLQVQMYTSMKRLTDKQNYVSVVLLANKGQTYQVSMKDLSDHEFIYRMALRKTGKSFDPSLIQYE